MSAKGLSIKEAHTLLYMLESELSALFLFNLERMTRPDSYGGVIISRLSLSKSIQSLRAELLTLGYPAPPFEYPPCPTPATPSPPSPVILPSSPPPEPAIAPSTTKP